MKAKVYNLIILDESGSMTPIAQQTISGCNETINTIHSAQKQYAETQEHFISIFVFQGNGNKPSRYLVKNVPATEVVHINFEQYTPWGSTPLYDAVGSTLADLKAVTADDPTAIGSVTIITDGQENSSSQYSMSKVAKMIEALKEMGWNFNFIGANIDAKQYAQALNIDNSLQFEQSNEGTRRMFEKQRSSHRGWMARANEAMADYCACAAPERDVNYRVKMRKASDRYFDDDRGIDDKA